MFNLFKKKKPQVNIRDILFGDVPIAQWPKEDKTNVEEPWATFVKARSHLRRKENPQAIQLYKKLLTMAKLESRHYLQTWHFLKEVGIRPSAKIAKKLYGVIVEVALDNGLDIVAAYTDFTARYHNYSGAAIVWDAPDNSLESQIKGVLNAGNIVVDNIGPWEEARPPAPPKGQARISMLTASGLHFGQAPFDALAEDQLGGQLISTATTLMHSLIEKADKKA